MLIDNISVFLVLEQNRTPFIDMLLTLAIGLHRLPEVFTIQDYDEKVKTLIQCLLHIQSIETNADGSRKDPRDCSPLPDVASRRFTVHERVRGGNAADARVRDRSCNCMESPSFVPLSPR